MAKAKSGYPKNYSIINQKFPKTCAALEVLGTTLRDEGPLDVKTGHLIQLAAAASIRAEGAVHSHTRRALEAGATPDELRHAVILLTSTIGFPNVAATLSWVNDILGKK